VVGSLILDILIVLGFILVAGLFVAAEIALISFRQSAAKQITGKRGARLERLLSNPNRFLAAAQVGVTLSGFFSAALGTQRLGIILIPRLEKLGLSKTWSDALSIIGLTLAITYLSLVLGELVPKRLALTRTEFIAQVAAPMIDLIAKIFRPVIILLSVSTDAVVKLFGIKSHEKRAEISEAELVEIVSGHSDLSQEEREIVEDVFNASDLQIHEVMVPRTEVDFLDASLTLTQARASAIKYGHSRFPVVRGNSDEVVGFLLVRDLLDPNIFKDGNGLLWEISRPIISLPGSLGVLPALSQMRASRDHIAIVLDEYGGTDGIVTLEDLVETLIGEIEDEYDDAPQIKTEVTANGVVVDGLLTLEDLASQTGITLPEGPYETISGLVMQALGRIPHPGDQITKAGIKFTVKSMDGKRVADILLVPEPTTDIISELTE
jgi:putative hemolysin